MSSPPLQTIPARRGAATILLRGQSIKIINTHGKQVVDTWSFALPTTNLSKDDPSAPVFPNATAESLKAYSTTANVAAAVPEFMSMSHTRASLLKLIPEVGDSLVSQKREKMLTMVEDTSPGIHDTLIAACDRWRYSGLGVQGYHESCTDNCWDALDSLSSNHSNILIDQREVVVEALKSLQAGMGGRVPDPFNLFMNIPVSKEGELAKRGVSFEEPVTREGDFVRLRAERDVVVVMSACPQDVLSINGGKPMDAHFQVLEES